MRISKTEGLFTGLKNKMKNYQKELEKIIEEIKRTGEAPTLLLHSCCAPCSSWCLYFLSSYFKITVFYYNPNIYPEEEYYKRVEEQKRFIEALPSINKISFIEGEFDPEEFYNSVKGFEKEKEGGERCFRCYRLRLLQTALLAKEKGFDYFTTTLTISPLKNAAKLNEIAKEVADELGIKNLPSDFKKENGYKMSTELSKEYGLYRQDYCGCIFSLQERKNKQVDN